ncbi:MAG TPA: EAL domain-containing protein [Thermomicrobiales bacterium]|nr:EAL domain-containing protein [Thermomicrobiales bacterium]
MVGLSRKRHRPVAEETGLIVPIGAWALNEACRQLRAWQDRWPRACDISMSVNLSGRQFKEPGLADEVARVLRETGLAPRCLNLEITETIMMADEVGASAVLRELEQLGVTLAIDDFGTGYSSLGTLRHFPVEMLKIDRSFVDGLGAESDDSVIVSGVVGLAHGLGLRVVAEGVESADQLARLRELGCDLGQGYYFERPLPADEAAGILAELGNQEFGIVAVNGSTADRSRPHILTPDSRFPIPDSRTIGGRQWCCLTTSASSFRGWRRCVLCCDGSDQTMLQTCSLTPPIRRSPPRRPGRRTAHSMTRVSSSTA